MSDGLFVLVPRLRQPLKWGLQRASEVLSRRRDRDRGGVLVRPRCD